MSSDTSTIEATDGTEGQTPTQPPAGNFDDKGRFVRVKGAKYSKATLALIARYNDIIDNLALFREPAVAKHVLNAADISDKPAAIQNLAEGLRKLLDDILEESKKNDRESADATLTALRTQLTEEFDDSLAQARDTHDRALNAKNTQIAELNLQLSMYSRLGAYQNSLLAAVNTFLRLINGKQVALVGITPVGLDENTGDTVQRRFEVEDYLFTVTTTRPDAIGRLTDFVTISSARDSKLPKLVTRTLPVRTDPANPGLNSDGQDTLGSILRKMTYNWFSEVAPKLTDEEIAQTFRDPAAVRAMVPDYAAGASLYDILLGGQGHTTDDDDHDPTTCPGCSAFLKIAAGGLGDDVPDGLSFLTFGPNGPRLTAGNGLGSWRRSRNDRSDRRAPGFGTDFDKE